MNEAGGRGHPEWVQANSRSSMEQDRKYIHDTAQLSAIYKFPARLLNVDNLEANGTVKQITPINYPVTNKAYLSMGWAK